MTTEGSTPSGTGQSVARELGQPQPPGWQERAGLAPAAKQKARACWAGWGWGRGKEKQGWGWGPLRGSGLFCAGEEETGPVPLPPDVGLGRAGLWRDGSLELRVPLLGPRLGSGPTPGPARLWGRNTDTCAAVTLHGHPPPRLQGDNWSTPAPGSRAARDCRALPAPNQGSHPHGGPEPGDTCSVAQDRLAGAEPVGLCGRAGDTSLPASSTHLLSGEPEQTRTSRAGLLPDPRAPARPRPCPARRSAAHIPCWKRVSVTEVTSRKRALMGGKWAGSLAKMRTSWGRGRERGAEALTSRQLQPGPRLPAQNCHEASDHGAGPPAQPCPALPAGARGAGLCSPTPVPARAPIPHACWEPGAIPQPAPHPPAAYLPREVDGRGLGDGAVHLAQHLAQLRDHGGEVVEQGLHGLLEDGADRLRGQEGGVVWAGGGGGVACGRAGADPATQSHT